MLPLKTTLVLILWLYSSAFADREARSVATQFETVEIDTVPAQIVVESINLRFEGANVVLQWTPLRNTHPTTGTFLTGYKIYTGHNPCDMQLFSTTPYFHFRHRDALEQPRLFYKIAAYYAGRSDNRPVNRLHRNNVVLLDFEEEELELLLYSEDEDVDPNAWDVTDEEALPESDHSLRLSGNTWKRLPFQRTSLTDSTVWSIGILSVDGDTMANVQAFGIGDGVRELFYSFHGMESFWEEHWIVSYQDVYRRDQWRIYRMAVGYDWGIRYDYLPSIDELYFINDNDNNDPSAVIYFDQLINITPSIPPEPKPKLRWSYQPNVEGPGTAVAFHADVDNRDPEDITYYWEFGDDATSNQRNPVHSYRRDGIYTAALTVTDEDGRIGRARSTVEVGNIRTPNLISACFTGDVMLGRRYEAQGGIIRRFGPETVFERIQPRFAEADLCVINLECLLTDEGTRHPTKGIVFRSNPNNVAGLTFAGIDVVTLANNHVIDYGRRGLEETMQVLDAAGIAYNGAGLTEYEALQPSFTTVNGIRVGVLSYCNRTGRDYNDRPFMDAAYDRYGYAYFSADNLVRSVPDAAAQCDLLVVYTHGGWEYETVPCAFDPDELYSPWHEERLRYPVRIDSAMRELEHLAIDLGAGLIIGGHPHVLQGFEVHRGVFIAHSMGNFAFDQNFFETWASVLVCTDIGHDGVENVWIEPIFVDNYRPTPAIGALGRKIIDRLAGYSYDLNAIVVPHYNRMQAKIALEPNRVTRREAEHVVSGQMRYFEDEGIYRSEPLRLNRGGFPSCIVSIEPDAQDPGWQIFLGREIILVGNMESEGAQIWNYNTNWEGRDEEITHSGHYSSYLIRQQGWQDGITDLTQRIPVNAEEDRLTLCGWLRTINSRDGRLDARYYRFRYNNDNVNILGDQTVERQFQGDNDWTYVWDQLIIPERTEFMNVRWKLFGANAGQNQLWADDVELIRWEELIPFNGELSFDYPNDLYYLQVETRRPVEAVEVVYRTVTLEY